MFVAKHNSTSEIFTRRKYRNQSSGFIMQEEELGVLIYRIAIYIANEYCNERI